MSKDSIPNASDSANLPALLSEHGVDMVALREALRQMPAAQRHKMLVSITGYTGAPTVSIDQYLGQRLILKGCVLQQATVKLKEPTADKDGNPVEYGSAERVVIKVETSDKKEVMISFVSMAVASFMKQFIIPFCGMGDFKTEEYLPVIIRQNTKGDQRTYNCQVVE